jgi:hypothetical protein
MGMRAREAGRRGVLIGALACTLSVGACGGHSENDAPKTATSDGGAPGESPTDCVPYDDTCPTGSYCQYVDGRTQCVAEGAIARDELCNDGARCHRGSICLYGSDRYGDSCQQPCSLDEQYKCTNGRHTCFVAEAPDGERLSFGVCRYIE